MRKEVKDFLASGKLEEYLMGLGTPESQRESAHFISNYPEVRKEYESLQQDIEAYANSMAQKAPEGVKASILKEIQNAKRSGTASGNQSSGFKWIATSAALLALLFAAWMWSQRSQANDEYQQLEKKYNQLVSDCDRNTQEMAALVSERALLLDPATQTVILAGDAMGSQFYAAAFWNKEKSVGHLNLDNLPTPPDKHCIQLWADVDGKMVNLGILPINESGMMALPFKVAATSLNVTIEPEGGSDHPTVSRIVASVPV